MSGTTLPNGGILYGELGQLQSDSLAYEWLSDALTVTGGTETTKEVEGVQYLKTKLYTKDSVTIKETVVYSSEDEDPNSTHIAGYLYEIIS